MRLDNQTERAYQVIFEENGDGRRRARIQTFTLAHDGAGGVVIIPEHVYVNGEGELTSQTISYGSPYPVRRRPPRRGNRRRCRPRLLRRGADHLSGGAGGVPVIRRTRQRGGAAA